MTRTSVQGKSTQRFKSSGRREAHSANGTPQFGLAKIQHRSSDSKLTFLTKLLVFLISIQPMLTGEIRNQIDRIWDTFWSGGISNPLEVIEQITYLLFLKRLDEQETGPTLV